MSVTDSFNRALRVMEFKEIAESAHSVHVAYCKGIGEKKPSWMSLDTHTRDSIINGVEFALSGNECPEKSHQNWLNFKEKSGWKYSEKLCENCKTHPNMVPYKQLMRDQQFKDSLFIMTVKALAENKEKNK